MIASLATGIALEMGLPREEIERIRVASLLHDLGKLAVPPEILDKPTALSDGEWQTIGEHPRIGQLILEQASSLREAIPVVLHHHERFNGGGYPHGLRGNEIPMGARIVAVADAYHAMVHDRPYKTALDHDQALTELRQNAGTQFDPEVVAMLLRRLRRWRPAGRAGGGLPPPRARPRRARAHRSTRRRGGPGRRGPERRRARDVGPPATQPIDERAVRARGDRLMSRRRVTVMVAILAALVGAPSSVFGAHPNQLSQASVTPASGGTSTLFVVTVRYRSPRNPATAVTAKRRRRMTAMTLVIRDHHRRHLERHGHAAARRLGHHGRGQRRDGVAALPAGWQRQRGRRDVAAAIRIGQHAVVDDRAASEGGGGASAYAGYRSRVNASAESPGRPRRRPSTTPPPAPSQPPTQTGPRRRRAGSTGSRRGGAGAARHAPIATGSSAAPSCSPVGFAQRRRHSRPPARIRATSGS